MFDEEPSSKDLNPVRKTPSLWKTAPLLQGSVRSSPSASGPPQPVTMSQPVPARYFPLPSLPTVWPSVTSRKVR